MEKVQKMWLVFGSFFRPTLDFFSFFSAGNADKFRGRLGLANQHRIRNFARRLKHGILQNEPNRCVQKGVGVHDVTTLCHGEQHSGRCRVRPRGRRSLCISFRGRPQRLLQHQVSTTTTMLAYLHQDFSCFQMMYVRNVDEPLFLNAVWLELRRT